VFAVDAYMAAHFRFQHQPPLAAPLLQDPLSPPELIAMRAVGDSHLGQVGIRAALFAGGIDLPRRLVRDALRRVDPTGTLNPLNGVIHLGTSRYQVPSVNSLWHPFDASLLPSSGSVRNRRNSTSSNTDYPGPYDGESATTGVQHRNFDINYRDDECEQERDSRHQRSVSSVQLDMDDGWNDPSDHREKAGLEANDKKRPTTYLIAISITIGLFFSIAAVQSVSYVYWGSISRHLVRQQWTTSYSEMVRSSIVASFPLHESSPYSTATHPRTPDTSDRSLSLAEYLTTRLGSHFSTPSSGTPSHLWITIASHETVRLSTRNLINFLEANPVKTKARVSEYGEVESLVEMVIARELVTICIDQGCMDYCRSMEWYCYGGFIEAMREEEEEAIWQRIKVAAIVTTLESGRRIFVVDK
jgi:hypothetical protein